MLLINKSIINFYYKLLYFFPLPVSKGIFRIKKFLIKDRRQEDFNNVFKYIKENNVVGDYLEFGVYRGKSFELAYNCAKKIGLSEMNFWAFDSFEGLPSGEEGVFHKSEFRNTKNGFMRFLEIAGVEISKIHVISGFYDTSLHNIPASNIKASVIHIDCDLYESTKEVLSFIKPLLTTGTILIFDDWFSFDSLNSESLYGEKKAFNEWQNKNEFCEYKSDTSMIFIKTKEQSC